MDHAIKQSCYVWRIIDLEYERDKLLKENEFLTIQLAKADELWKAANALLNEWNSYGSDWEDYIHHMERFINKLGAAADDYEGNIE
jgi:broad specificity phosphatase PhoE